MENCRHYLQQLLNTFKPQSTFIGAGGVNFYHSANKQSPRKARQEKPKKGVMKVYQELFKDIDEFVDFKLV